MKYDAKKPQSFVIVGGCPLVARTLFAALTRRSSRYVCRGGWCGCVPQMRKLVNSRAYPAHVRPTGRLRALVKCCNPGTYS
eukprot:4653674-Prymnesium_polylepis.2